MAAANPGTLALWKVEAIEATELPTFVVLLGITHGSGGSSSSRRAAPELLVTRALGIYSAQRRAQVLSAGRKTPFLPS
jgi:hypothetical protein